MDEKSQDKDSEAFHFIAYIPISGGLYELDGLKPGPIKLSECDEVGDCLCVHGIPLAATAAAHAGWVRASATLLSIAALQYCANFDFMHSVLQDDWLDKASIVISERIGRYAAHEIKFNLMAVVRNRKDVLQEQLDDNQRLMSCLQSKLVGTDPEVKYELLMAAAMIK